MSLKLKNFGVNDIFLLFSRSSASNGAFVIKEVFESLLSESIDFSNNPINLS